AREAPNRSIRFPVRGSRSFLERSPRDERFRPPLEAFQKVSPAANGKPDGTPGRGGHPSRAASSWGGAVPKWLGTRAWETGWNAAGPRTGAARQSSVPKCFPSCFVDQKVAVRAG